ncbi:alpha/beta hydrolase [Lampropedia puyangensis]|uniref:Alpha/beta hydrolase n=1 Tax=Lampropedia puyangensis TaxID=1330072 RepID=A0A4S8EZB8_9BURK|nr:alpha/beta hydrolase [Lampropedia puyangensis]THU00290.1 alpha/beta hydrolase [Lampropedia puyangensis]
MPTLYRNFTTQAAIDEAYNPSLGLDNNAIMEHYTKQAQHARASLDYIAKVPYGPTLDETLDIFPAQQPGAPVLVFIHGGYWRALSAADFSGIALGPCALGMTVVSIDYSLCPKVTIDEITRQARAAVAWVVRNIAQYNGDANRITIAGHSAGAHLAAMCLQTDWKADYGLKAQPLHAGLLVSGIFDIAPLRFSYLQPMLQLNEGVIQRNSPMFGCRPCTAPVLLTWGGLESSEFERQSTSFLSQWQSAGNTGTLLRQNEENHFSAIHGFESPTSPLCSWLKSHC